MRDAAIAAAARQKIMRRHQLTADILTAAGFVLVAGALVHHVFRLVAAPPYADAFPTGSHWLEATWALELGVLALGTLACAVGLAAMMHMPKRPVEHDSVSR